MNNGLTDNTSVNFVKQSLDILLPVYNGEKYLPQLIDSLRTQTMDGFYLLLIDDGSIDSSFKIIKSMNGNKFNYRLFESAENRGVIQSYNSLLDNSSANYVMFCDQDDVWFPDKIEKCMTKMIESEQRFGKETPILIFSDFGVVDEQLKIINTSYFKYQNINPKNYKLHQLLTQNVASGCTMLANRALIDLVGEIPQTAVMHDHWFALVAATFGKIIYLDEPTLYYRQHKNNVFGASAYDWNYFYKRYCLGLDKVKERFYLNVKQAKAFLLRYEIMLSANEVKMLTDFAMMNEKNWLARWRILIKHKIYKSGWRRNIGTMLII